MFLAQIFNRDVKLFFSSEEDDKDAEEEEEEKESEKKSPTKVSCPNIMLLR